MASMLERDRILRESWVNAKFRVPDASVDGEHFSVEVWGVIKDPLIREGKEFQDVVAWWPALRKWTVTHQCRGDEDVTDYPCNVLFWQPLPPMPWG